MSSICEKHGSLKRMCVHCENEKLREENKKLRECVEFYADKDRWVSDNRSEYDMESVFNAYQNEDEEPLTKTGISYGGKLARKTLKEINR